jgi:hypothetical protein
LTDTRCRCEIYLAPSAADAQGADAATEADQVHAAILIEAGYPPIIALSTGYKRRVRLSA